MREMQQCSCTFSPDPGICTCNCDGYTSSHCACVHSGACPRTGHEQEPAAACRMCMRSVR